MVKGSASIDRGFVWFGLSRSIQQRGIEEKGAEAVQVGQVG